MVDRTFIANGVGLGDNPVSIVVNFNGEQIFNNTIPTIGIETVPLYNGTPVTDAKWINQLFSWDMPISENDWDKPMSITVTGGDFIINKIQCNFSPTIHPADSVEVSQQKVIDSQNQFEFCYMEEINGVSHTDSKFDVKIDGEEQIKVITPGETAILPGEWWWKVGDGSTIEFTLKSRLASIDPSLLPI